MPSAPKEDRWWRNRHRGNDHGRCAETGGAPRGNQRGADRGETSGTEVRYFFATWQLADLGWPHAVIPDAVFAFSGQGTDNLVLEYDRGTEPLSVLVRKLESYDDGLQDFPIGAVVLVTETSRRTDLLGRTITQRTLQLKPLAAPLAEVSRDVLGPIFVNVATGLRERLIEPPPLA